MDYYDKITNRYLEILETRNCYYRLKIEILSAFESAIGEIVKDISRSTEGQLNVNYQQLSRRSCNITLANVENRYLPSLNQWYWIGRKFKLYIGVRDFSRDDNYWFSQGVFYTLDANNDGHTLSLSGVDKGNALTGELKLNALAEKNVIEVGSSISRLIRQTLSLNDGVNVLDPVMPIIDKQFEDIKIEQQIEINEGEYIGTLFTQIADSYGSDIYYDTNGRLTVEAAIDIVGWDQYDRYGCLYTFTDKTIEVGSMSASYSFAPINTITVFTNITAKDENNEDVENVSYTAYNTNALSPLNIKNIGIRRAESVEAAYIDKFTKEEMTERCKQIARYYLLKESIEKSTLSFNTIIIPHLDVNKVIGVTNKMFAMNNERCIIDSLSLNLSSCTMTVSATRITVLPSDTQVERVV